ncbi:hypothetical protein IFM89_000451 [Coptis chinensis]|uniref:Homeobox domain-containing protein n=1 Tax=Coptis chinensis TaxID=261450 RepID=A0A835I8Y6_9MAGN|nr:hypothetical protein IFM89_000451 [Coptis chinensis]
MFHPQPASSFFMAGVTSISRAFLSLQCEIIGYSSAITPSLIFPPRVTLSTTTVSASSRRRNNNNTPPITCTNNNNKKKKKNTRSKVLPENDDDDGFDEDSIEALFSLLEEDLKNDLSSGDEDLTEEDLDKLEKELEGSDDELSGLLNSEKSETDDDEDEERPVELKKWQLRRLASALKIGRRKTSIKSLAAELCLDRAVVLHLLRDPPPNLLLLSAALPHRIVQTTLEPESKPVDPSVEFTKDVLEPQPEVKLSVHMMQSRWSMQKRLKKVQLETLERVYNRTKRPTNAMISSVVHVTNLPRKRVVKWFEDKRAEDGVPHNRLPYQPSTSESMLIN